MDAIGYVRVSKQEGDVEGLSPDVQREAVRAYAQLRRLKLVDIVEDLGVSGGKPIADRRGGKVLVQMLNTKPRVLIASRQDRLFRSIKDAVNSIHHFRAIGVDVVLIAEGLDLSTPAGRLLFHVMAAMGEYEREIIGIRTREAIDLKKTRREQVSPHAPFGYAFKPTNRFSKKGKIILEQIENPAEQQMIRQMLQRLDEGYSYRRLAKWLDDHEVKTRNGRKWNESTLRQIVAQARERIGFAKLQAQAAAIAEQPPAPPVETKGLQP